MTGGPALRAVGVEQFGWPTCEVPAGSTCRTRGGKVAPKYHTPRFVLVDDGRVLAERRKGSYVERGATRTVIQRQ
ncbi:hypothetical protein [Streptomyces sp. NRRL F-2580]|uniref:zinc finger domain-containing protein n=1 Tax=Streptomyces sp. NRRL F-2580 TaxID=1463841 RepID=UPI00099CA730